MLSEVWQELVGAGSCAGSKLPEVWRRTRGKVMGLGADRHPSTGSCFPKGTSKVNTIVQAVPVPRFQNKRQTLLFLFTYIHSTVHVLHAAGLNKDNFKVLCQLCSRSRLQCPKFVLQRTGEAVTLQKQVGLALVSGEPFLNGKILFPPILNFLELPSLQTLPLPCRQAAAPSLRCL